MALKWQTGAVAGGVSLLFIFTVLLNLTGMSYSHDGDKACTDCYSLIEINSTYWQINVEHAGSDTPALFKKSPRSRTLWLNLDQINEVVTTDPEIHVEILVPAIKRTSTLKHPDFGYLRTLKDGDTLIHRNTKSRSNPSRIVLHGLKGKDETIKWSFLAENILMENIDIDPTWLSLEDYSVINRCDEKTRMDTVCSNVTKQCTQVPVVERYNCKIDVLEYEGLEVECPDNARCDVVDNEFCVMYCYCGDCNYNLKQAQSRGWCGSCQPLSSLSEGSLTPVDHKEEIIPVVRK